MQYAVRRTWTLEPPGIRLVASSVELKLVHQEMSLLSGNLGHSRKQYAIARQPARELQPTVGGMGSKRFLVGCLQPADGADQYSTLLGRTACSKWM